MNVCRSIAVRLVQQLTSLLLFLTIIAFNISAQQFEFLATQVVGSSAADVGVEIVDPTAATDDDYRVTVTASGDDLVYSVENVTTQMILVENQPAGTTSPVVEGLQVTVFVPTTSQYRDFLEVAFGGTAVETPVHIFRPGDRQGQGGNNSTNEYTFVGGGGNGGIFRINRNEAFTNFSDYEIRFDGNPGGRNKLVHAYTSGGTADVPFSVWNIGQNTPDDTSDDYQVIAVGFDDSNNPEVFDGGAAPSDGGSGTMFDRIYIHEINGLGGGTADINGDGQIDYDDFLQDLNNNGGDVSANFFAKPYLGDEVLGRFSMVALNNVVTYQPPNGTTIRITSTKQPMAGDVFEFAGSRFGLFASPVELDFGNVQLGSDMTLQLDLVNAANSTITISSISENSSELSIANIPSAIAAGDTATVDVIYRPTVTGPFSTTFTIMSDDAQYPSYVMTASGEGLPETNGAINILGRLDIPNLGVTDIWGYYDAVNEREYAILGGAIGGISIVDVTDPARPQLMSQVSSVPGFDVKVYDHYAYSVNGGSNGLGGIVDIEDPANPVIVGDFPSSHNIFITETGYIVSEFFGLRVFDLNPDPTDPQLIFEGGTEGHDASVIGNTLFDFHGRAGTFIYDFSDPANPGLISSILDPAISYHHSGWTSSDGDFLFICDELANHPSPDIIVYDISDLSNPQRVGEFADPDATIHNLFVLGDYAVTSYYNQGFQVFDVSNPANISKVDQFDTSVLNGEGFDGAWGVYPFAPSGNIYISDQQSGLHIFELNVGPSTGDPNRETPPGTFALFDNYPNPFNPETRIDYVIGVDSKVRLEVYNMLGQKVRTLRSREQAAGSYNVIWDGSNDAGNQVASGIYFYRLEAGDFVDTKRMLLVR